LPSQNQVKGALQKAVNDATSAMHKAERGAEPFFDFRLWRKAATTGANPEGAISPCRHSEDSDRYRNGCGSQKLFRWVGSAALLVRALNLGVDCSKRLPAFGTVSLGHGAVGIAAPCFVGRA
jgi:hypothetical protein